MCLFRNAKKLCFKILLNFVWLGCCIIPKSKKVWVFGAWFGKRYDDNSRYLFEYVMEKEIGVVPTWVAKDRLLFDQLSDKGVPVVMANSLRGLCVQARAGVAFCSHSIESEFNSAFLGFTTQRVQLWHGTPIKDIVRTVKGNRVESFVRRFIFWYELQRLDIAIATCDYDQQLFQKLFRVKSEQVFVTGFPRNDRLWLASNSFNSAISQRKKIVYLPTYRSPEGSSFEFLEPGNGFDPVFVDKWLIENDAELHIKLHPVQSYPVDVVPYLKSCQNISFHDDSTQVSDLLAAGDIFIVDYSSVLFDIVFLNRPFVIFAPDYDCYKRNDQGLAFDLKSLAPQRFIESWSTLLPALNSMLLINDTSDGDAELDPCLVPVYRDACSCDRVLEIFIDT